MRSPRTCRVCGCTQNRACEGGCWWVERDLCSSCRQSARERPILFSGPMVRALLEGRKTQTRRIVKLPHANPLGNWEPTTFGGTDARGAEHPEQTAIWHTRTGETLACPYGVPGDRLWVRETWAHVPATAYRSSDGVQQTADPTSEGMAAVYAAGWERSAPGRWRPSIHMPRWACRLVLEITGVRVQRLRDISEADAVAEGASTPGPFAVHHFADLWVSINGRDSWNANPWVWALTFKRVESAHG